MAELDADLLHLRDLLEVGQAAGDMSFDWLLLMVRQKIDERARLACTPDHLNPEWMFSDLPPLPA